MHLKQRQEKGFSTLLGNEINTSPIITKNKIILAFSSTCVCFADNIDFGVSLSPTNVSVPGRRAEY